jgi:hypothetical protein
MKVIPGTRCEYLENTEGTITKEQWQHRAHKKKKNKTKQKQNTLCENK